MTALAVGGGHGMGNITGEEQEQQEQGEDEANNEDSGNKNEPQKERQKTIKKVTFTRYERWYF